MVVDVPALNVRIQENSLQYNKLDHHTYFFSKIWIARSITECGRYSSPARRVIASCPYTSTINSSTIGHLLLRDDKTVEATVPPRRLYMHRVFIQDNSYLWPPTLFPPTHGMYT
ncbi:hypothetical protein FRC02_003361 [Tulasnella sp. 418]|nr:hypothetical protein FRC02_003361 [Tulasnella sp. 418]